MTASVHQLNHAQLRWQRKKNQESRLGRRPVLELWRKVEQRKHLITFENSSSKTNLRVCCVCGRSAAHLASLVYGNVEMRRTVDETAVNEEGGCVNAAWL